MKQLRTFEISLELMGRSKDGEGEDDWTLEPDDLVCLDTYDMEFENIEDAIKWAIEKFPQLKATKDNIEMIHECQSRISAESDSKLYDDAEELGSESVGYAYCEINEFILENEGTTLERKLYCNNGEWN